MLARVAHKVGARPAWLSISPVSMSLSGADSRTEVFEVCNERNEVVGTELRGVVHREGLFHRAVNVLLFNGGGDLLLQRRAADKDVCPGRCGHGRPPHQRLRW